MRDIFKLAIVMAFVFIGFMSLSISYAGAPAVAEAVNPAPQEAPKVEAPPAAPVAQEQIKTVEEVKLEVKDEAFVPPVWIQDALLTAKSLPVIGPILVKVFQWLGVLASIMTALFIFLWTVLASLEKVLGAAKMTALAEKLAALQNSKFMYYLKALSVFNAQKKDKP